MLYTIRDVTSTFRTSVPRTVQCGQEALRTLHKYLSTYSKYPDRASTSMYSMYWPHVDTTTYLTALQVWLVHAAELLHLDLGWHITTPHRETSTGQPIPYPRCRDPKPSRDLLVRSHLAAQICDILRPELYLTNLSPSPNSVSLTTVRQEWPQFALCLTQGTLRHNKSLTRC